MSLNPSIKMLIIAVAIIFLAIILSLFELYTQLGRYQSYWQRNNSKPAVAGEVLYVALGDSTAQGIGASKPQKGYVGLVAENIATKENSPVRTVNLSKSGAKVKDVIDKQLPALKQMSVNKNTYITIEIGANDMSTFNADTFKDEMDKLMSQLPKQTLISDVPYFGGSRYASKEPNVEQANKIMRTLASEKGFELVNLHDRMKQNSGIKTLAADMFHPSNTAYRENWALAFSERLNN